MTSVSLEPQELQQIEHHLQNSDPLLQKRARIILLYAQGQRTQKVAEQVGLSRARTRYWRHQFELHRMQIFSPKGRTNAPSRQEIAEPIPNPLPLADEKPELKPARSDVVSVENKISPPFPTRLERPGMLPDDPIAEAGRKVMLFHFVEMLRHESGTLAGEDIEALHDMRVATRRMRAAFDVFAFAYKPKIVKAHLRGLRTIGRALGRVRDLDVFIEKAGAYLNTLPIGEQRSLDPLLSGWNSERERLRVELSIHMRSSAYQAFKEAFNIFLQTPGAGVQREAPAYIPPATQVRHLAPTIIYTRLAALRAYDAIIPNASIPQLHALRIEFKKLRYTLEYFQEVLGKEAKPVISEIKKMQDHLGNLQDAEVACTMLRQYLDGWDQQQIDLPLSERLNPEPIVTYLANRHTERHNLAITFPEAWAAFNNTDLQRNLALSIAVL